MDFVADLFVNLSNAIRGGLTSFLQGGNIFGFHPAPDLVNVIVFLVMAIIVITVILIVAPVMMMYETWLERKVVARLQDRVGPNRVGPFGLLQPIADMIKFFTKEDITPTSADRVLHLLAPIIVVIPVVLAFAVIPWGKDMAPVDL